MAFTEALRLLIDADTRGAVRGIQQVGAATDRELGKSQKRIDAWSRGLTTAGAGMVALGAASLLGLGKAAQASEEANLATVKLENTLGNMPKLAGENSKSFIDLAQAIQSKTAADGDQIVEAEALLGTFNLTGQEIRQITPLVVDLARKFGIDMSSAAVQVGKALDGNISALKRNGISIDEAAFATDRYGAVTKALRDQVGGFAEEEGKTFAGSVARLKNELGDLAEGVGSGAVDAFSTMFGAVDRVIGKFEELSPGTQKLIGQIATFGSVALIVAGGLSFTIGQLIKMKQTFDLVRTSVADFAGAGGLGRLARVTVVVGGLIALREVLGSIKDDIESVSVAKLENELLSLGRSGEIAGEQLSRILGGDGPLAAGGGFGDMDEFSKGAVQFKEDLDAIDEALAQLATRDPEAAAAAFREVTRALEEQGLPADRVKAALNDYADAVASGKTAAETAKGGVDELTGAMGEQAGETSAAQAALQEYSDTLSALFDPLFGATDALMDNAEAQAAVKAAELELIAATQAHGATSAEAAAAQQKLAEAHRASGKSALDLDQAMAELRASVADGTTSVAAARDMLSGWVRQGLISQSTADALAGQFDETTGAAKRLGATDPNVRVTETGNRSTRVELTRTRDAAHSIPQRTNTHVGVSGAGSAISLINSVSTRIRQLDGSTATVHINARATSTGRVGGVPIFHEGVHRVPGRPGEDVLAYVQAGEKIISASQAAWGGGNGGGGGMGGGGGQVIEVHTHLILDGREITETVDRHHARNNGRNSVRVR